MADKKSNIIEASLVAAELSIGILNSPVLLHSLEKAPIPTQKNTSTSQAVEKINKSLDQLENSIQITHDRYRAEGLQKRLEQEIAVMAKQKIKRERKR